MRIASALVAIAASAVSIAAATPLSIQATFASALTYDAERGATTYCRAGLETFSRYSEAAAETECATRNSRYFYAASATSPDVLALASAYFPVPPPFSVVESNASRYTFDARLRSLGFFTLPTGRVTLVRIDYGPSDKIAAGVVVGVVAIFSSVTTILLACSTNRRVCGSTCSQF